MFHMLEIGYLDSYDGVYDLPSSYLDCNLLIILLTTIFLYLFCLFFLKHMTFMHCLVLIGL